MTDWEDPAVIAHIHNVMMALIWVSTGAMLMDTVRYASFDWQMIKKRSIRLPQFFYLTTKFFFWVYILTCVIALCTFKEINCQAAMTAVETFMGFVAVSSSMVLACRTLSVVDSPVIQTSVGFFALAVLAAWMAGTSDVKAAWFVDDAPSSWTDGFCGIVSVPPRYSIKYVLTVAFDLYILVLTTVQVIRKASGTRLGSVLASQGIIYFTATALSNLVVCTLTLLQKTPLLSICGAVPSACICVMASTRLYVQLTQEAEPGKDGVRSTSNHSSAGEKIYSYMRRATSYGLPQSGSESQSKGGAFDNFGNFSGNHPFDIVLPITPGSVVTPGNGRLSPLQERTGYFDDVPSSKSKGSHCRNNSDVERQ